MNPHLIFNYKKLQDEHQNKTATKNSLLGFKI